MWGLYWAGVRWIWLCDLIIATIRFPPALRRGAYKYFPRLKTSTDKFEYGFKLKEFEREDPWKVSCTSRAQSVLPRRPCHGA